jgi:adenylate kinase
MKKQAVFIFGTPGAGKGTQANLLAWTKGFYHFDSGKELRAILHDPTRQDEELVKRERKLNDSGILNTPSWVLGMFKEASQRIGSAGMSLVFSGSPRTLFEAFGDEQNVGLVTYLQDLYGKENVHAFYLDIDPEIAANRNIIRRTCTVCTNPVLGDAPVSVCPICEGELKIRKDDNAETYKTRYHEYTTRTLPILDELKKRGMDVVKIDATQKPPAIFKQILEKLGHS